MAKSFVWMGLSAWPPAKIVLRKASALFCVLIVAFLSGWILDQWQCLINVCSYDWLIEPEAIFAIFVLPCYSIITLGIVFAVAVALRKRFPIWLCAAIPAGAVAFFFSALFYSPEVDTFTGILSFFGFLAVPWFLSNLLGLYLWPAMPE